MRIHAKEKKSKTQFHVSFDTGTRYKSRRMSKTRASNKLEQGPGIPIYDNDDNLKGLIILKGGSFFFHKVEVTMQVKSACRTNIKTDPETTVGITRDGFAVLFFSKDYDNEGNIFGSFKILGEDKRKFNLLWYNYSLNDMKKLFGNDAEEQKNILIRQVKMFVDYHTNVQKLAV